MISIRRTWWCLIPMALFAVGCSSGGGSDGAQTQVTTSGPLAAALPLSPAAPLVLAANTPGTTATSIEIPADFDLGTLLGASMDLATLLNNLTIVRTDGGSSLAPSLDLEIGFVAGDDPVGACGVGAESFGATITGDASFNNNTVSPSTAELSQAALDIINGGAFSVCIAATSSVDAELTLSQLGLEFGFDANCSTPPEAIVGSWSGTYSCQDLCGGLASTEDGDVVIDVTQSGETALYSDDSGATYVGSVCGSGFRHFGFGSGYFEYGTFTRTGATTAVKSSTWVSIATPNCGGTCSDTLTLTPSN